MAHQWTQAELSDQLNEQVGFLKSSCIAYDSGISAECKRLATTVRVMLHDTGSSKSLFTHLGIKSKDFLDSSLPYDERQISSHSGLVAIGIGGSDEGTYPFLDDVEFAHKYVSFDDWWDGIVFVDSKRHEFSRKDIVTSLANEDGGAHVAKKGLSNPYNRLTRENSIGLMRGKDGTEQPIENQVPATMRQIAHEVLKTLDEGYTCKKPDSLDIGIWTLGGGTVTQGMPDHLDITAPNLSKTRPIVNGVKIGRNDPCHCGSGKKYKHCHLL